MMLTKKMKVILLNFMVNLKMMTAVMMKKTRRRRRRKRRRRRLRYQRGNGCHQRGYDGKIMTIFGLMEESRKMQFKPRPSGRRELTRCVVDAAVFICGRGCVCGRGDCGYDC